MSLKRLWRAAHRRVAPSKLLITKDTFGHKIPNWRVEGKAKITDKKNWLVVCFLLLGLANYWILWCAVQVYTALKVLKNYFATRVENLSPAVGRGINSKNRVWNWVAKLQRLAGRYDNPMPTWFLVHIAGLKLPTQLSLSWGVELRFFLWLLYWTSMTDRSFSFCLHYAVYVSLGTGNRWKI